MPSKISTSGSGGGGSGSGGSGGGGSGSGGRDEIYLEHFHTVDATKHGMYNLKCLEVSQTPDVGAAWYVVFFLSQLNYYYLIMFLYLLTLLRIILIFSTLLGMLLHMVIMLLHRLKNHIHRPMGILM